MYENSNKEMVREIATWDNESAPSAEHYGMPGDCPHSDSDYSRVRSRCQYGKSSDDRGTDESGSGNQWRGYLWKQGSA